MVIFPSDIQLINLESFIKNVEELQDKHHTYMWLVQTACM